MKRKMRRFNSSKGLRAKMNSLGFPSNHESHSSLQRLGYDNEIVILDLASGTQRRIFKPREKAFVGHLDLHWDGDRMLFARSSPTNWSIWEIRLDGTGLRRVSKTPEDVDCYEPCYLPDGRIIVASNAPYQCVPCWHGVSGKFVANLYVMNADGSGMRRLCFDQDHDSNPSVRNDGRVVFSRWDYTGINRLFLRPLMVMSPDGTGQRAMYGSNSWFPNALYAPRELPGAAGKFVSIMTGYHGSYKAGSLVIIDTNKGTQEAEGIVKRISGRGAPLEIRYEDRLTEREFPKFLTPYPITDEKILVAARMKQNSTAIGLYLADTSDRVRLIHEEEGIAFTDPVPVKRRRRPPVIPDRVDLSRSDAVVYVQDVHVGPGLRGVPRGAIKSLRVIGYNFGYIGLAGNDKIGLSGPWEAMRILGTTPVEKDGSAVFRVPANEPIAFQALDAEGKAVQLMRTWVTTMPGEFVSCIGCHESASDAPPSKRTVASERAPRDLVPWYGAARGFDFAREVQPVLDVHCVSCHDGSKDCPPDLRAEDKVQGYKGRIPGRLDSQRMHSEHRKQYGGRVRYTPAYEALLDYVRRVNLGDDVSLLDPGHYHADTSELIQILQQGHYGVQLPAEAWDRLVTWIDLNGPCHGTWADVFKRPVLNRQHERRMELAKLYGGASVDPEILPKVAPYSGTIRRAQAGPQRPKKRKAADSSDAGMRAPAGPLQFREIDLGRGKIIKIVKVAGGNPFWMSVCEISNEQFRVFDPSHDSWLYTKRHPKRGDDRGVPLNGPSHPALRVSWNRAVEFCGWLSGRTGENVTLPTEAQWEHACRAGTSAPMHYGDTRDDFSRWANVADRTFTTFGYKGRTSYFQIGGDVDFIAAEGVALADSRFDDGHCVTAPVGSYQANAFGLKDMHGNVAEWTSTERGGEKIVKGGSYLDRPSRCASTAFVAYPRWQRVHNTGFRIVITD
ncbi:MAG: SUMF1/EgtB/PvdO family nonheme iron enzyme [Planctomycetota bacterium]